MLKTHDRFFEYADDMNAYSKGRDEKNKIFDYLVHELDYTPVDAALLYCDFVNGKAEL